MLLPIVRCPRTNRRHPGCRAGLDSRGLSTHAANELEVSCGRFDASCVQRPSAPHSALTGPHATLKLPSYDLTAVYARRPIRISPRKVSLVRTN